tara:strand:+ start:2433 stop:2567 length:135 start_codon:yes stop_codon:yes gene_type:complete
MSSSGFLTVVYLYRRPFISKPGIDGRTDPILQLSAVDAAFPDTP